MMCNALREIMADELEESWNSGLEEGRNEGRSEGRNEGLIAGRNEGLIAGRNELENAINAAKKNNISTIEGLIALGYGVETAKSAISVLTTLGIIKSA